MRIALSGSHGTGKTTLFDKLSPLHRINEIAREAIKNIGNPIYMDEVHKENFEEYVLYKQMGREITLGDFFSDRSLIDVLAYSQDLPRYGEFLEEVKKYLARYPYDVVFFLPIEFPMESDGVRPEDEEYRSIIEARILRISEDLGVELVTVRGTLDQRTDFVKKYLTSIGKCI